MLKIKKIISSVNGQKVGIDFSEINSEVKSEIKDVTTQLSKLKHDIKYGSKSFKSALIFYSYPTDLNGLYEVDLVVPVIGQYDLAVFGRELCEPNCEAHQDTIKIISQLNESYGTEVFGYVPIGCLTPEEDPEIDVSNLTIEQIKTRILSWKEMGAKGIFLDEFGYDYRTTRERQNEVVDFCHANSLHVIVNAWITDHVFGTKNYIVEAGNTKKHPGNPNQLECHLTEDDYVFFEHLMFYAPTNKKVTAQVPWDVYRVQEYYEKYYKQFKTQVFIANQVPTNASPEVQKELIRCSQIAGAVMQADVVSVAGEFWSSESTKTFYVEPFEIDGVKSRFIDVSYKGNENTGYPIKFKSVIGSREYELVWNASKEEDEVYSPKKHYALVNSNRDFPLNVSAEKLIYQDYDITAKHNFKNGINLNGVTLNGNTGGSLTCNNQNIVRSVNGVNADTNGNVVIQVGGSTAGDSIIARSCFEDIGTAGQKGFGQSACSDEIRVKELGFRALHGTVDPDSDNYYGVYEHEYAGLCCYIPKFWVRIGNENAPQYSVYKNDSIEIASGETFNSEEEAKTQGYFLPRAFIDGGEIKRGFFLQKYNSRISSSNRADGKNYPTSYITNNNLVSIIAPDMIDRAKLLGDNWNVATCFMLAAHQLLTLSLAQMAKWYTWCKWYKSTQNYQYPTIGLSATNEGLYTHNGMPNGISGLSYVWQFCTGITTAGTSATQGQTAVTSNDIYLLKKEKSFTELTSGFGGNTDAWGTSSSLLSMYDKYTSPLTLTTNRAVRWGNGEYDVLTNGYNKDTGNIVELDRALCGVIPKDDNAISSNGSNQMASSLIYQNPVTQNLAFYFGGEVVSNGNQPCFSRLLDRWRTLSYGSGGFRCACYA